VSVPAVALAGTHTVALGVPDNIGRLIGKRVPADRYEDLAERGMPMPDFHLATGIDNEPIEGLAASGFHLGLRNGVLRPDGRTLRRLPWAPGTALVICDAYDVEGNAAEPAPRWVLRRQVERLERAGLSARCATELEFYLYRGSYERLHATGYRELVPSYHLSADNDLLVSGWAEEVIGAIRHQMPDAGVPIEVSQGEGGTGQHEISLAHAEPVEAADRHVVYKHGVKDIAAAAGYAATFMAKVDDRQAGSSCHVHISLAHGGACAVSGCDGELSDFGRAFLGGLVAHTPELMLLHAPYANSYRRLRPGSLAPANMSWGHDNRTAAVRMIRSAQALRFEVRVPGADVNPYFALAAVIAAGLAGVERRVEPPPPTSGDAYATDAPPLPGDLTEAVAAFAGSEVAAGAFGEGVRDHFVALGRAELGAHRAAVTDWDLRRGFERA
jgi:glutamine synthetase